MATSVNGTTDPQSISSVWKNHFEKLLNSVKSDSNMPIVNESIDHMPPTTITITPEMVKDAIQKLKTGKSCGNDGLAAEHFKHASANINVLFSLFYTTAINHGYLPNNFMKTIIVPLVNNKTGDISDVNNYRPIALVTVTSKIFENILLDLLHPYLYTCDNQFGFKKRHVNRSLYICIEKRS